MRGSLIYLGSLFSCTGLTTASWSAVIRGAILKAVVRKRKIRAFYGVRFQEAWTKEKHEIGPLAQFARTHKYSPSPKPLLTIKAYPRGRVYDEYEQLWRCTDRIQWYVKKVRYMHPSQVFSLYETQRSHSAG